MEGNPICVRIPWDKNPEALAKWAEAKTGFPWIDAIMTQLRQEGWIHHLARHAVACFLTRGDLWISWEEGMKVNCTFREQLSTLLGTSVHRSFNAVIQSASHVTAATVDFCVWRSAVSEILSLALLVLEKNIK